MIREDARMIAADMQLEFRQTAKVAQDLVRKDPTDATETSRPKGDDRRMDSALAAVRQGLTATAEASKDLLLDLREANREVVGEIRSSVLSWTSRSEDSADRRTEVVAATGGGRSEFLRGTGKKVSKGIAKEAAAFGENLRGKHSRTRSSSPSGQTTRRRREDTRAVSTKLQPTSLWSHLLVIA